MSKRQDQEREKRLEPKRVESCKKKLEQLGFEVELAVKGKALVFEYNGCTVTFFPYSGWHAGKSIKDGRGFENLLKQINHGQL